MHALLHAGVGAPVHSCLSPTQPHHATLRTKREREKRCLTFFLFCLFGLFGFFFFLSLFSSSISGLSAGGDYGEELNAVGRSGGKRFVGGAEMEQKPRERC